ncbi:permease prefix domain 1-containing protein [Actinoallomurus rhizosphaericola]|uniref:permease prefix domain 1-containing protein n=1 Tax=Actinoallomurus rhizosphaericola TaxID=2952536 RepID=UPI002091ECAE|nr:permease prefix domain 1-containing protein [Actinoallomurus rhizosphaericola]MCO5998004.1 permease prefix domain 1-containing protein [Actinoallomurus rhizosphaericola]
MRDPKRDFLDELLTVLRVGAGRRHRIAAEVSDHLTDLIEEERRHGARPEEAAERAVARFGDPRALAAEFNADLARHSLGRAAWALTGCVTVAFAAAGLPLNGAPPARPWPSPAVFYAVPELLVQLAIVGGLNALFLTVVAPRLRGAALAGRPAALAGRNLAAATLALIPVAVVAAGNLTGSVPFAERLPLAVLTVGFPLAGCAALRAAGRASWLASPRDDENVLDVIAAVCRASAGRVPYADLVLRTVSSGWRTACRRAPRLMRWLDLRHHPWRAAATVSVAAGIGLKTPDLLIGDLDPIAAVIEAATVYTCFAALGGLLGLRGGRAGDESEPEHAPLVTT